MTDEPRPAARATPTGRRLGRSASRPVRIGLPLVVLVAAAVLTAVLLTTGDADDAGPPTTTTTGPAPVAVSSDAPRYSTLEELEAASDVVVRGRVATTERGRLFGDPGSHSAVESRLVTLEVAEVLGGDGVTEGTVVLVEEEGWLPDGAPLVVDGAAPSAVGDDGIWFLVVGGDRELSAHVIVNAQGRYLVDEAGHLRGVEGGDPLVAELSALTVDELAARVRALPVDG